MDSASASAISGSSTTAGWIISSTRNALRLFRPTGKRRVLDVARQAHAAGHDDAVVRTFAPRGLGGGSEKLVEVHGVHGRRGLRRAGGNLFDFVAQDRRLLEVFVLDGLGQFLLQRFQPVRRLAGLAQRRGHFAHVPRALVHGLEQAFEALGEGPVTFRAAEPAGLLEIRLGKTALRTFHVRAAHGLLDFLRRAQPQQQVREREARRVIHALALGAAFAQVHLLHLVTHDLGEMDRGRFFFANAAQHKSICISARRRFSSRRDTSPPTRA